MSRLVEARPTPPAAVPVEVGRRWVDRLDPRVLRVLTVLGFAVPVVAYLWFIHHYGVNVIYRDQWSDVDLISHSYDGTLGIGSLWALHYENRMLFPNLIVLLLSRATSLNVVFEEYLAALMLFASAGLLIYAHRRRAPSTPLLYYCPVAILMLSLVQYGNTLWGYQMCWYLVLLALASAVVLLDRPDLTRPVLAGAVVAGVVGSFSLLQGLLIWPVGLVLLYHRRRSKAVVATWLLGMLGTAVVYFAGFGRSTTPYPGYAVHHPLEALKFFSFAVGDVVGVNLAGFSSGDNPGVQFLGVLLLVLCLAVVVLYGIRRDTTGGGPIGVALVGFGLLFAAMITEGRIWGGFYLAGSSKYRTYDLLIVVGCYLALLGRPTLLPGALGTPANHDDDASRARRRLATDRWVLPVARSVIGLVILAQIVVGLDTSFGGARDWQAGQTLDARVLANHRRAPVSLVHAVNGFVSDAQLRRLVPFAAEHRLSLFGSADLAAFAKQGLPEDPFPPSTAMTLPKNGAVLRGTKGLLLASASAGFGVAKVEFRLSGGPFTNLVIGSATSPSFYGWLAFWNTRIVPNGTYAIQSIADGAAGDQGVSPEVVVTIDNAAPAPPSATPG